MFPIQANDGSAYQNGKWSVPAWEEMGYPELAGRMRSVPFVNPTTVRPSGRCHL